MVDRFLPLAAMERILKAAGAERVAEDAKMALKDYLEEEGVKLGEKALRFARHAGRKTVKAEDIKLAKQA